MSRIISIGTALPQHRHRQQDILQFMLNAYQPEAEDRRRISLLYERSGIAHRYSVIPDYAAPEPQWEFYPRSRDLEPFPTLEQRMETYGRHATALSISAIRDCLGEKPGDALRSVTSLITVSCTGMSAPGLDISIMEELGLPANIQRSSVNFMGCYAAIHALKMADHTCRADPHARVLIVCTELCTLHFQKDCQMDSIASGLLFGDGSAAVLVSGDQVRPEDIGGRGLAICGFYSEVALQGQHDMAWHLSGKGFLMKLSAYIPQLLQAGIEPLLSNALAAGGHSRDSIGRWAIHPGGKKILENIAKELKLSASDLKESFDVLRDYGNMSSPTILFVLKQMMNTPGRAGDRIFTAAFGPGITMETVILEQ